MNCRLKSQASFEFYAPFWPVNQSAGTSVMLDAESQLSGMGMCKLLNLRRFLSMEEENWVSQVRCKFRVKTTRQASLKACRTVEIDFVR
jgi:hypothetical protein